MNIKIRTKDEALKAISECRGEFIDKIFPAQVEQIEEAIQAERERIMKEIDHVSWVYLDKVVCIKKEDLLNLLQTNNK